MEHLETQRLFLRRWRPDDLEPFARMNADPRVMAHFPALVSRDESQALIRRFESGFDQNGFGFWAVELKDRVSFIGFIGLNVPRFEAPFMPAVEIGWRIAAEHWNQGFATEGARAALKFGFDDLDLPEIVSFTVPANLASRRVMEKTGMEQDLDGGFDHPLVAPGSPLRRHVLYRLRASDWRRAWSGA